jgi:SAM-dependent MidA family methyltransferase
MYTTGSYRLKNIKLFTSTLCLVVEVVLGEQKSMMHMKMTVRANELFFALQCSQFAHKKELAAAFTFLYSCPTFPTQLN